jgi:alpha-L-arabinofuranosidase
MATYPEWERVVLEHCYDAVDYISLHMYFANREKDTAEFLALNAKLDAYIGDDRLDDRVRARAEAQRKSASRSRSTSGTSGTIRWRRTSEILGGAKGWPHAPPLLEDVYNFEDVLQVGCILNTFIRRSDVVKMACIAQLVNVIAPIMTEPKGAAWRQTIYYPYYFASIFGRGAALRLNVSSPGYDSKVADNVPYVDIAGVHDEAGRALTFFAVNRHASETIALDVALDGFGAATVVDCQVMTAASLEAVNTAKAPLAVTPRKAAIAAVVDGRLEAKLAPYSYQMIRLSLA